MVPDPKALLLYDNGGTYRTPAGDEPGEVCTVLETKEAAGEHDIVREIRLELPGRSGVPWLKYSPGRRSAAVSAAKKAGTSAALIAVAWASRRQARNGVMMMHGMPVHTNPVDVKEPSAAFRAAKGAGTVALMWGDLTNIAKRPVEGYYTKDHTLVVSGRILASDIKDRYELL